MLLDQMCEEVLEKARKQGREDGREDGRPGLTKGTSARAPMRVPSSMEERYQAWFGREFGTWVPYAKQPLGFRALVRQGYEEGLGEARLKWCAVESILIVLLARALAVTPEQQARIEACADIATAQRWLERAATVGSTEGIFGDS